MLCNERTTSGAIHRNDYLDTIMLKSVAVRKLQVGIIARSSREMSQTVLLDWPHFLSRVCVSVRPINVFIREKHQKNALKRCRLRECLFQWTSNRPRKGAVTASRLVARDTPNSDNLNGENCGHDGDRLSQKARKSNTSQNGDDESLYIHGLNNLAYELLSSPCVCSV